MDIVKQVTPIYNVATASIKGYKTGKKLKENFDELSAPIEETTFMGKAKAVVGKVKTAGKLADNLQVEAQVANKIIRNVPKAITGVKNLASYVTGKLPTPSFANFANEYFEKNKDLLALEGARSLGWGTISSLGGTTFQRIKRSANNLGFTILNKAKLLKGKAKDTVQDLLGDDGEIYYLLKKRMFKVEDGRVIEVEPKETDRFLRLDALTKVARMNVKRKTSYEDKDGNVYQFNKDNKLVKVYDNVLDRFVNIEVVGEYPELLSLNKRMDALGDEFDFLREKFGNFSPDGLSTSEASNVESIVRQWIDRLVEPTGDINNKVLKDFIKVALQSGVSPTRIEALLKADDPNKIKLTDQENAIYNFFQASRTGEAVVVENAIENMRRFNVPLEAISDRVSFTRLNGIIAGLSQSEHVLSNYSASLRSDIGIGNMLKVGTFTGTVLNTFSPISISNIVGAGLQGLAVILVAKAFGFTGRTLLSVAKAALKLILPKKKDDNKTKAKIKKGPYLKEDYEDFLKGGASKEMSKKLARRLYQLKQEKKKKEEQERLNEPDPDFSIPYDKETYDDYLDSGFSKEVAINAAREYIKDKEEWYRMFDYYDTLSHNKRQKEDEVEEIEEKDQKVEEILKKTKKKEEFPQFFPNPFTNNPKIVNLDVPESFETRRIKSGKKYSRKQPVISKALVTASSKEIQMAKPKYTLAQAYAQLKKAKKPETKRKWREIIRHLQSLESNSRLYGYDQPIFNEDQSKYVAAAPPAIIIEEPDAAPVRSSVVIEDDVVMAGPPSLHTAPTILLPPAPSSSNSSSENSDSSAIVLYSNSQLNEPEPPVNEVPPSEIFTVSVPTRLQCFLCGQPGHYATQCPNKGSRKTSKRKASSNLKKTLEKKESIKNILKSTGKPISRASSNTFRIDSKKKSKKTRRNRRYCHCGGCCNKCCDCC